MDEILIENRWHFSSIIENEDELWRSTCDLYLSMAQKSTTDDAKRQVLLQLADDAKQQYAKFIRQAKIKRQKPAETLTKPSKMKVQISQITFSPKFILFLIILRWFIIITIIFLIIFIGILSSMTSTRLLIPVSSDYSLYHKRKYMRTGTEDLNSLKIRKAHMAAHTGFFSVKIWIISIGLLLSILFLIFASSVRTRRFITSIYYKIQWLRRLVSTPTTNIDLPLESRSEKIVLLDPLIQHSQLRTLFDGNLFVYTSIYECFDELSSNHLKDYTLFLPFATFEVHSLELTRLSNVSLCIFYEDNDSSHPQIFKTKYHIRFLFPETRLLEHLRHTIILNYTKQAHICRLQDLENEADENFLAASQQCRMLANDLEEQSSTINGREAVESWPYMGENMGNRYLQSFTFLPEH